MATVLEQLSEHIDAGWRITHLILLGQEWQCNITNDEYVATGTGSTLEEAVKRASFKAFNETFAGRIFDSSLLDRGEVVDLRSLLGLNVPKVVVNRRI